MSVPTLLPATQTPEYAASNTQCPDGLLTLDAVALQDGSEPRPALRRYLDLPDAVGLLFDGRDRGFVADRAGRIWRFAPVETAEASETPETSGTPETQEQDADGASTADGPIAAVIGDPVVDLSGDTATEHDQGLVGLTRGPQGRLWINRTQADGTSVLSVVAPNADGTLGEPMEAMRIRQVNAQHNGGSVVFDSAGRLYVSFGDGGGQGDPHGHGQNLATALGSILRLSVVSAPDGSVSLQPAPGNPAWAPDAAAGRRDASYPVPEPDGSTPAPDERIWAYGVRNPYRMWIDPETDDLWVTDVGQQCVEEVNVLSPDEAGANLGWNAWEGSRRFYGPDVAEHRVPDFEYRHGRGLCAIIGGQLYRGSAFGYLRGRYVFADLCGGDLYAAAVGRGAAPDDVLGLGVERPRPVSLSADADGELYVVDLESGIWKLAPAGPAGPAA